MVFQSFLRALIPVGRVTPDVLLQSWRTPHLTDCQQWCLCLTNTTTNLTLTDINLQPHLSYQQHVPPSCSPSYHFLQSETKRSAFLSLASHPSARPPKHISKKKNKINLYPLSVLSLWAKPLVCPPRIAFQLPLCSSCPPYIHLLHSSQVSF